MLNIWRKSEEARPESEESVDIIANEVRNVLAMFRRLPRERALVHKMADATSPH